MFFGFLSSHYPALPINGRCHVPAKMEEGKRKDQILPSKSLISGSLDPFNKNKEQTKREDKGNNQKAKRRQSYAFPFQEGVGSWLDVGGMECCGPLFHGPIRGMTPRMTGGISDWVWNWGIRALGESPGRFGWTVKTPSRAR